MIQRQSSAAFRSSRANQAIQQAGQKALAVASVRHFCLTFGEFDSTASILAFVHHTHGVEGLKQVLASLLADGGDGDYLERQSVELEAVGLPDVADIVREAAKGAPSPINPHPDGSANGRDWDRRNLGLFRGYQITEDTE